MPRKKTQKTKFWLAKRLNELSYLTMLRVMCRAESIVTITGRIRWRILKCSVRMPCVNGRWWQRSRWCGYRALWKMSKKSNLLQNSRAKKSFFLYLMKTQAQIHPTICFRQQNYIPNYMDCLNDRVPDRSACAKVMENELTSDPVTNQYYFLLVFVLNYRVTMGKYWKYWNIAIKQFDFHFSCSPYFMPGNRDNPHDDRGRPSLLAPEILCWLLACWLAYDLMSILLLTFVTRRWAAGLSGNGECVPYMWWSWKFNFVYSQFVTR